MLAKEAETCRHQEGVQAAHVGLPIEENRARPLGDVTRHERHNGFIAVERHYPCNHQRGAQGNSEQQSEEYPERGAFFRHGILVLHMEN